MAKSKKGRPSTAPRLSERIGMSLRVTPDMKERLERAAVNTGRSLSQEAELRLERTFRDDDLLSQLMGAAYGEKLAAVLMIIGETMSAVGPTVAHVETQTPEGAENWLKSPVAFDQASKAAQAVLGALAPTGPTAPRSPKLSIADGYAKFYLDVASGQLSMTDARGRWGNVVQEMLGSDLIHRIKQRSS